MICTELLESRRLMVAVSVSVSGQYLSGTADVPAVGLSRSGTLTVIGTSDAERILINEQRNQIVLNISLKNDRTTVLTRTFLAGDVRRMNVHGAGRGDWIEVNADVIGRTQLFGGRGDDRIVHFGERARLDGGAGDDTLVSDPSVTEETYIAMTNRPLRAVAISATRTQLSGGPGDDVFRSRGGEDSILGGSGDDRFEPINAVKQFAGTTLSPIQNVSDVQYSDSRIAVSDVEATAPPKDVRDVVVRFSTLVGFP